MRVTTKVTINQSWIAEMVSIQRQAIELTAEAVLTDIRASGVVPKDKRILEDSGFVDLTEIQNAVARIIFDTPYARRLYWHPEYNFRTDKNPNARGKWMEPYHTKSQKREWVVETFGKFVRMLMRQKGMIK